MKIYVDSPRCLIGDEVGNAQSKFYNFPSCERLHDGTYFISAREIDGLQDPYGRQVSVRYDAATGEVAPALSPTCHDMADYPEKGMYMCHVTELAPGKLVAVYLMIDTDKSKPLFSPENDGVQNCTCRIVHSEDGGKTWEKPKTVEYTIPDIIIPSKIQKMPDGTVGFPIEVHNLYGEPYREPIQARFIYSVDGGRTFDRASMIPHPADFLAGDARCTFDTEGNMTIFFWGYDLAHMKDLEVHRSQTRDSGKTFDPVSPILLKKQITSPFYVDRENFLCIYQERFSDRPGIKAMLSHDGGYSWDEGSVAELYTCQGTPDSENAFQGFDQYKFGYSTLTRISGNSALATYWNSNGPTTCISACRIEVR